MDLPDNILDELEYLDNITSCNKVENCLMLSEYEQNLIKEKEWPQSVTAAYRRARKWSLVRQSSSVFQGWPNDLKACIKHYIRIQFLLGENNIDKLKEVNHWVQGCLHLHSKYLQALCL